MAEEKRDTKRLTDRFWLSSKVMLSLKIPEERVAILIGRSGATKALIEKRTETKIYAGGEIEIDGDWETEAKAGDIVKAIGRGFSPGKALRLIVPEVQLDVISLKGSPNTIKRLLARVIGTQGKSRKNIERLTGAHIAVYGKTISIIGDQNQAMNARSAVEMLLSGRTHSHVWKRLEERQTPSIVQGLSQLES